MSARRRLHLLPLVVAVIAELCSLALLAVSGWYLASCALAGLGLLATFSYPTPSGIVRMLALGRIGAGYGQNVLLHRSALADTTRARLAVFDDLAATGSAPADDRAVDRLLTDAAVEGERVLRVTAPLVVTISAVVTAIIVAAATFPLVTAPLLVGAAIMFVLALAPAPTDDGHGRLRAEVLASMDAAPELESLGGTPLLRARVLTQLDTLTAADRRLEEKQSRRQIVAALAAGLAFGAVLLVCALAAGMVESALLPIPLFVMVVLLAFGVLERTFALGEIVPHLQRLRSIRARRGSGGSPGHVSSMAVGLAESGALTLGGAVGGASPTGGDIVMPAGATAAIIGPSGTGKSTLLAQIAEAVRGTAAPTADPRGTSAETRTVAVVTDDEFLFTGTVAGNLRLGEPDQAPLSAEDIRAVLEELDLSADIGAETRTGIGGRALSRGETRRLVIARAVLSAPDVLLVDEPDLGLDPHTFATVLAFVRTRLPEATIVYAAHSAPPGMEVTVDLGAVTDEVRRR
ncbi:MULTISPECIES: ATP-binding cassette domain-containing protein [Brevibacterium]|uniref:ATP-binding cassette domain-containing protein n=1 Tax=Brevibacterium casei TaxID=33889 RepID=A0A7T4A1B6_9MICO|nr:ATP-binding cassette domain-containing protein [Brevibacterium casei]QQB15494.1 ATP-binding cassette domain-containing protein [Brevibacterium casei]